MDQTICKSCGESFSGTYCNHCGEKVIHEEDRKLKHFFSEFINALTFADTKLWRTLRTMVLRPGAFSKDFVEGKRVTYMKPLAIFFLANLLYFVFPIMDTFNTKLQYQSKSFAHSELVVRWVENEVGKREIGYEAYEAKYNAKTAELSKMLLIIICPFIALFFSIIHVGSNRQFYVDHLTVSLEMMAFILLFCVQLPGILLLLMKPLGLGFLLSDQYITSIILIILGYFFWSVEQNFYEFKGFRMVLNVLLCISGVAVTVYLYRAILFFVTYWTI
ncbi:MAG: hypothetical protein Tsb0034_04380 [Ekhidna sp.]